MKRIPSTAGRSTPWLTVTTASLTLLLAGASLGGFAQYDRGAILRGEVWRLVTGHLAHWSAAHLGYDLFALVVLGAICERPGRRVFAVAMIGTALLVSLYLLAFRADVETYRGLSAIDSALWMQAVFNLRPRLAVALSSLFLAKVLIEAQSGALFVDGITVLPVVHLIGAAVGFIMAAWSTSSLLQHCVNCAHKWTPSRAASSSTTWNAPRART